MILQASTVQISMMMASEFLPGHSSVYNTNIKWNKKQKSE